MNQMYQLAVAAFVSLSIATTGVAQSLSITNFTLGPAPRLSVAGTNTAYYILYRGGWLTNVTSATDVALGTNGLVQLEDPLDEPSGVTRFYRVEEVPLDNPHDLNGDGVNDVQDLLQGRNPLRPAQFVPLVGRLSLGTSHTVALQSDGTLSGWGRNNFGQVGDGITQDHSVPVAILAEERWTWVSAGNFHTAAIRADGTLWTWGRNNFGQIGDESVIDAASPVAIKPEERWQKVAAGQDRTLAVRADGTLWAWGRNNFGQLGDGTTENRTAPVAIREGERWSTVAAGALHTLALHTDGTLWAWGNNDSGRIGDGTRANRHEPVSVQPEERWRDVAAGGGHSIAIRVDGTLWAWGNNTYGQLGDGTTQQKLVPVPIQSGERWLAVSAGDTYTMALREDGTLWAWGIGGGQLGDVVMSNTLERPTPVAIRPNERWLAIAASRFHSAAVRSDGTLWTWGGANEYGEFGDGTIGRDRKTPTAILPSERWQSVAAAEHTLALGTDGTLRAWGENSYGQLGDGTTITRLTPVSIQPTQQWRAVAAGMRNTVALSADGALWSWGSVGLIGIIDDFSTSVRTMPVPILPGERWLGVTIGGTHAVALRTDKTLWAWGINDQGQVGTGTPGFFPTPTQVAIQPGGTWQVVEAGNLHTMAIRTDGRLWGWGENGLGQIGDGTSENQFHPVAIQPEERWSTVSAGGGHTVALRIDGTLWAWGYNANGQVGDGTMQNRFAPVAIHPEERWSAISAGNSHTTALRSDGTLWAWGSNGRGQLGDGTTESRFEPVAIMPLERWTAVAAGYLHTIALRADGTLWGWGATDLGALGVGPWRQVRGGTIWGPPAP